jgi:hypothetical protein
VQNDTYVDYKAKGEVNISGFPSALDKVSNITVMHVRTDGHLTIFIFLFYSASQKKNNNSRRELALQNRYKILQAQRKKYLT